MNEIFYKLRESEQKIGNVVEKIKSIEYLLDCIIINRIEPKDLGFVQNIILNSSIISIGGKLKIIKTICKEKGKNDNFQDLHRLINIRNLFAHETSYVEDKDMIVKMNELKSDGKYIESEFEKAHQQFLELFNKEYGRITLLLSDLKK